MKTKLKKSERILLAIIILIGVIVMSAIMYVGRHKLMTVANRIFPPETDNSPALTEEQKLEDFEYLYNLFTESMPMIDEYEKLYGFSFRGRKEMYRELVLDTKTDIEFYSALDAIVNEVPSFHTDIVSVTNIDNVNCYNALKVRADRDVISFNKKYETMLAEAVEQNSDMKFTLFSYMDGGYYFDRKYCNSDDYEKYAKIIEVDGIPVDEYIINQPMGSGLFYDGAYRKPARNRLVFNDSIGEKVSVTIENPNKTVTAAEMYISIYAHNLWYYSDLTLVTPAEDFFVHDDDENKVSYVRLDSMSDTSGYIVENKLKKLKYDNVILDLRGNYGGLIDYASDYVYPQLFKTDLKESNYWYMPSTEENNSIFDTVIYKLLINPKKAETNPFNSSKSYYKSKVTYKYDGSAKKDKNVIILTSKDTGSAADRLVSDLKKNGLATIIGNNTGGEGLMNSFCMINLPNSRFACVYMIGGTKNPDGTDNAVHGTAPDYYISQTVDGYYLEQESENDDYTAQLEYDTVLNYAIEVISK